MYPFAFACISLQHIMTSFTAFDSPLQRQEGNHLRHDPSGRLSMRRARIWCKIADPACVEQMCARARKHGLNVRRDRRAMPIDELGGAEDPAQRALKLALARLIAAQDLGELGDAVVRSERRQDRRATYPVHNGEEHRLTERRRGLWTRQEGHDARILFHDECYELLIVELSEGREEVVLIGFLWEITRRRGQRCTWWRI